MLGKKSQGPLMSCGCSPGGEHEPETTGVSTESVLTGPHDHPGLSPFGHLFRISKAVGTEKRKAMRMFCKR